MSTPGGIKRNNPGNLRPSPEPWEGQCGVEGGFCVFKEPVWGLRALAMQLIIYQQKHGCETIAALVHRWAPPNENNTAAYTRDVSQRMQVSPDARVDLLNFFVCANAIRAFVWHENGTQPYPPDVISEAAYLAGVRRPAAGA